MPAATPQFAFWVQLESPKEWRDDSRNALLDAFQAPARFKNTVIDEGHKLCTAITWARPVIHWNPMGAQLTALVVRLPGHQDNDLASRSAAIWQALRALGWSDASLHASLALPHALDIKLDDPSLYPSTVSIDLALTMSSRSDKQLHKALQHLHLFHPFDRASPLPEPVAAGPFHICNADGEMHQIAAADLVPTFRNSDTTELKVSFSGPDGPFFPAIPLLQACRRLEKYVKPGRTPGDRDGDCIRDRGRFATAGLIRYVKGPHDGDLELQVDRKHHTYKAGWSACAMYVKARAIADEPAFWQEVGDSEPPATWTLWLLNLPTEPRVPDFNVGLYGRTLLA
jgi:hypothetical protein